MVILFNLMIAEFGGGDDDGIFFCGGC